MADVKISALADGSPIQAGDYFVIARGTQNFRIPASSLTLDRLAAIAPVAGDISFNGFKGTSLADPVAAQDAATKHYVDTQGPVAPSLATVLAAGNDAGSTTIVNLGAPLNQNDAVPKAYIDNVTFKAISTPTYTLLATDAGLVLVFTSATGCVITIPTNATAGWTPNPIMVIRAGTSTPAGGVSVVAATGVTVVNPYSSFALYGASAEANLMRIGPDAWSLNGEVV